MVPEILLFSDIYYIIVTTARCLDNHEIKDNHFVMHVGFIFSN